MPAMTSRPLPIRAPRYCSSAKPPNHIPTTAPCAQCHTTAGNYGLYVMGVTGHKGITNNCKQCHASTEHEGAGLPQSVKAIILPRWLPRSEFDHEAHRMLACLSCHVQIPNSRQTADVNIPSIALCRQCHKQGGASQLAAEGRCFECHSYHDWRKERRVTGIMEMAQPKTSKPGQQP